MLGEAIAKRLAEDLFEHGVYVTPFSYPVVPRGKARIRLQVSATHTDAEIDQALQTFADARRPLDLAPSVAGSEA